MSESCHNAFYFSLNHKNNQENKHYDKSNLKSGDQRPTNGSTKEMGTADFTNIISSINKEEKLK